MLLETLEQVLGWALYLAAWVLSLGWLLIRWWGGLQPLSDQAQVAIFESGFLFFRQLSLDLAWGLF
jgi:hypothetical protein